MRYLQRELADILRLHGHLPAHGAQLALSFECHLPLPEASLAHFRRTEGGGQLAMHVENLQTEARVSCLQLEPLLKQVLEDILATPCILWVVEELDFLGSKWLLYSQHVRVV